MGVGALRSTLRSTLLALRSAPTHPQKFRSAPRSGALCSCSAPLRATPKSFAPLRSTLRSAPERSGALLERSGAEHFTALVMISYSEQFFFRKFFITPIQANSLIDDRFVSLDNFSIFLAKPDDL